MFAFVFYSLTISNIFRNISNVSFSISLNRLNASVIIKNLCSMAMRKTWAQALINVPPLKLGVYLKFDVHNALFKDPIKVGNE